MVLAQLVRNSKAELRPETVSFFQFSDLDFSIFMNKPNANKLAESFP